ncbi:hypothetical protein FHE65_15410 [Mumia zhuanghuii]|uniref:Uncharacterized protein n=1 Tax=Mumia zhuanghuii TaxID=2585211 RepID=A0A5C4M3V3_9ACTN|nr:hypothetical protein FHE65_35035 [Mumia zhuanghuii]TNC45198.1 hypothetical protein FHE65_15410 [Mumia zhuanghuii]
MIASTVPVASIFTEPLAGTFTHPLRRPMTSGVSSSTSAPDSFDTPWMTTLELAVPATLVTCIRSRMFLTSSGGRIRSMFVLVTGIVAPLVRVSGSGALASTLNCCGPPIV